MRRTSKGAPFVALVVAQLAACGDEGAATTAAESGVTDGVTVHFAEIYSGQYTIDDQFSLWQSENEPGEPMINLGEPTTGANAIEAAAAKSCARVDDGGWLGVYVYPEPLRGNRMSALVNALNDCTAG